MDSVSKTKEVKSKFSLAGLSVQGVRSGERAPQEIKPGVEVSNQYATINNVIETLVNQIKLIKGL